MKLTVADIQRATQALRDANVPTFEGHYFIALPRGGITSVMRYAMGMNVADKWAAEERALQERYAVR